MGSIRRKAHPLPENAHSIGQYSSGAMECYTWVRFAGKLTHCHNAHSKGQHSSGAMERYIWVRFAGKLTPCQTPHIAPVSISVGRWITVQGGFKTQARTLCARTRQSTQSIQRGDGGQVREGSKGKHSHPAMSKSQARAQQSVSSRASSTGDGTLHAWVRTASTHILRRKKTSTRTTAGQCKGQFKGAMERYTWVRFAGHWRKCRRGFKRRALCT